MPELHETRNNKTIKQLLEYQRGNLKHDRSSFDSHWQEISRFISPRRIRLDPDDVNRGGSRWNNIINNVATKSLRIAVAGMFAGNVSPARPWFALVHRDDNIMADEEARQWLHEVTQKILAVFRESNFYKVAPVIFKDLLLYGTSLMTHVDSFDTVARFYSHPLGSYWLGQSDTLQINQFVREFQLKTDQVVSQFGLENCSYRVKNAWDRGDYRQDVKIIHHVLPNFLLQQGNPFALGKNYLSLYYEGGGTNYTMSGSSYQSNIQDNNMFLAIEGFEEQPFYAPRWEVVGEDIYGTECPGMVALGDVKQIQAEEKRKGQAIDKQTSPPLQAPSSVSNIGVNSLPGGITIVDTGAENRKIEPLYNVNLNLQDLKEDILRVEERIKDAFFVNMFLAITEMQGVQPRNEYELIHRNDEKLLQLGPALQQVQGEFLTKVVDRVFNQLVRADQGGRNGVLPPIPQALEGQPLEVQYISSLAQAQRAVATQSMDRTLAFVTGLGQLKPEALDKIDGDWFVEEYARVTGVPPKAIVPDQQVQQTRQQREAQRQAMMQAQAMEQASAADRNAAGATKDQALAAAALQEEQG